MKTNRFIGILFPFAGVEIPPQAIAEISADLSRSLRIGIEDITVAVMSESEIIDACAKAVIVKNKEPQKVEVPAITSTIIALYSEITSRCCIKSKQRKDLFRVIIGILSETSEWSMNIAQIYRAFKELSRGQIIYLASVTCNEFIGALKSLADEKNATFGKGTA